MFTRRQSSKGGKRSALLRNATPVTYPLTCKCEKCGKNQTFRLVAGGHGPVSDHACAPYTMEDAWNGTPKGEQ